MANVMGSPELDGGVKEGSSAAGYEYLDLTSSFVSQPPISWLFETEDGIVPEDLLTDSHHQFIFVKRALVTELTQSHRSYKRSRPDNNMPIEAVSDKYKATYKSYLIKVREFFETCPYLVDYLNEFSNRYLNTGFIKEPQMDRIPTYLSYAKSRLKGDELAIWHGIENEGPKNVQTNWNSSPMSQMPSKPSFQNRLYRLLTTSESLK